ncbi:MAG: T9SS type A sorting domain-containing protein [Bacteroidota bacterium]
MKRFLVSINAIFRGFLFTGVLILSTSINNNGFCQPTFQRLYGSMDNDEGYSVTRCSSGGYLVSGSTSNFYTTYPDLYLLRLTENGDTIWTRSYLSPEISDWGTIGIEALDHSFVVGFNCSCDTSYISLHKYDDNGKRLWAKNYNLNIDPYIRSVINTPDSGIVFCGISGWPVENIFIIRTDKTGNEIWRRSYGGNYYFDDYRSQKIMRTSDNGYMVCGNNYVDGGIDFVHGILIKTDTSGVATWIKEYPSTDYTRRHFTDVLQNPDNSYIIAGYDAYSDFMNRDFYPFLMKTDQNGNIAWTQFYDFAKGIYSVFRTNSNQYTITGGIYTDTAVVAKTDLDGNLFWSAFITSKYQNSIFNASIPASDSGYIFTGSAASNYGYGGKDVLVLKANQEGIITSLQDDNSSVNNNELTVWPNPCTEKIEVKSECTINLLSIFDSQGICLYKSSSGTDFRNGHIIQTGTFPKGLLFIQSITNQGIYSQKFIRL